MKSMDDDLDHLAAGMDRQPLHKVVLRYMGCSEDFERGVIGVLLALASMGFGLMVGYAIWGIK